MIRLLFINFENTLAQDNQAYPHVKEALAAIATFETADGGPLERCLLANTRQSSGSSKPSIDSAWRDLLSSLDELGLRQVFEPVDRRVTMTRQANAPIPDKQVFATAIQTLGIDVDLRECMFITHVTEHVADCRHLGMHVLQFDPHDSTVNFSDWSEAPLIIAHLVAPDSRNNLEAGLGVRLAVTDDLEVAHIDQQMPDGSIQLRARKWCPLIGFNLGKLEGVRVSLPTRAQIGMDESGLIESVKSVSPPVDEIAEAASFVKSLAATGQIAYTETAAPGATYQVEIGSQGHRYLRRTRFTT